MTSLVSGKTATRFAVATAATLTLFTAAASAQVLTDRLVTGVGGAPIDGNCKDVSVSSDGRFIAFSSTATNLVANDTNGKEDVFLYDVDMQTIVRCSVDSNGVEGNNNSFTPSVSDDGMYVTFTSSSTNLAADDTNSVLDVFVYNTQTGTTTLVSRHSDGTLGDGASYDCKISGNGQFIVYRSLATNLIDTDTNSRLDIFMLDMNDSSTTRVSVSTDGIEGNGDSIQPSISRDGTMVAFASTANNLSGLDGNLVSDIFVRNITLGTTSIASLTSTGGSSTGASVEPCMSPDGTCVAFRSTASNLMPLDSNGVDDIFKYNIMTSELSRISVSSANAQANALCSSPRISEDGRFVSYLSSSSTLATKDTNDVTDVLVRDTLLNYTWRVSLSTTGAQGDGAVKSLAMNSDATSYVFASAATTMFDNDTNLVDDLIRTTTDFESEEISSITPLSCRATVVDAAKENADRITIQGTFNFNVFSPDGRFNPVADNFEFSIGNANDPYVIAIAANDGGWKSLTKQRYTWKSLKGETPVVNLTLDVQKGKFTLSVAKAEFGEDQMTNPIEVNMLLGNEMFNFEDGFSVKTTKAGTTLKYNNIFE